MKATSIALGFSMLLVILSARGQGIIVGGDFESPLVPQPRSFLLDVTPDGWVGFGDLVSQGYSGSVPSGNGNQWFDLNPGTNTGTGISQTISLKASGTYVFSFLYNGGGGGTTTQISYLLGLGPATTLSGSVSTAGMDVYHGTAWASFSALFTPSFDGKETLSLVPNGAYSGGFIDAVQIYEVPEPSASSLFAAAWLGILIVRLGANHGRQRTRRVRPACISRHRRRAAAADRYV